MVTQVAPVIQVFQIKAIHIAEKLKLKEMREIFSQPPIEFSNYEMVIRYAEESYLFIYNYGSVVFCNVPDELQEKELSSIQEYKTSKDQTRATDVFLLEVQDSTGTQTASSPKVYFDRVVIHRFSFSVAKIVCMLLAESTALEYYENLIENLLLKTNHYSKSLRRHGKMLDSTDLVKFIGLCMDTKQEIISNLYIVDSPDETWESVELDKLHQELKLMMEVDIRYRALDYKIKIIQESIEVIVDLAKSKRETLLELIIILLIAFEVILSLIKWRQ